MEYANPIISGFYPDPSICRVDDWYYLVTSTFEYFPGVPLFKSKDLVHWQQIGHCLTRKSQLNLTKVRKSGGIYAPTIRYYDGRYYMVTTNVDKGGNFYVYTEDIHGEWSDPIWVKIGGIDPTLFFDMDGKTYIVTNEGTDAFFGHIVLAEIDIKTGKLLTEAKELWKGTGGQYVEAPHLYYRHGWYYLMVAEGGTGYGHMETIARSKSIWGPYESCPHNPIITHRESPGNPIQATGHGDLVEDGHGNWWFVFLGIRPTAEGWHHLGRETFLAPVTWTNEGWPVINEGREIGLHMTVERPFKEVKLMDEPTRDPFNSPNMKKYWNTIRNPIHANYQLNHGQGMLFLTGTPVTLSEVDSPTFLGRRQQHFNCLAMTSVETGTMENGDEAGLTVFYSDEHHYEIAIVQCHNQRYLQVKKTVGDIFVVDYQEEILMKEGQSILLTVKADKLHYAFGWGMSETSIKYVGTGRTQLISTEVAKGKFTGTYLGMYVVSLVGTKVPFNWFDYQPIKTLNKNE